MRHDIVNRIYKKYNFFLYKLEMKNFKRIGCNWSIGVGFIVNHGEYISIGNNFYAGRNLMLQTWPEYFGRDTGFTPNLSIGNNVSMMENCQISCCKEIIIKDGCLFGANVFITDNFHGDNSLNQLNIPPIKRTLHIKGSVRIGANVWVGRNVCIMPGVKIGDGVVIGANAVVTHDIPDYSVAIGVPARIIR